MSIKSVLLIFYVFFFSTAHGQLNNNGMQCISSETPTGPAILNGLSYNGYVHTPKGQLKMLVVFVSSEEDEDDVINLPTLSHLNWYHDQIPEWAKGTSNYLFDEHVSTIGQTINISKWLNDMSMGTFQVTGEIYPEMVRVSNPSNWQNEAWNIINNTWQQHRGWDWSRFDNRTNYPNYQYDNSSSQPDDALDYVIMIYREQAGFPSGDASVNQFTLTTTSPAYQVNAGFNAIYLDMLNPLEKIRLYFYHEFAHTLYSSPHYAGANIGMGDGESFYVNHGWSFMASSSPQFETCNAFDRWWLDWKDPVDVAADTTVTIDDYVTSGDAIRIAIPNSEDHLWLEFHDKINDFDRKPLFANQSGTAASDTRRGLYGYITRGVNGRQKTAEWGTHSIKHTNFIKFLHNNGNKDFKHTIFSSPFIPQPLSFFPNAINPHNPISGTNLYVGVRDDFDQDNYIDVKTHHGNHRTINKLIRYMSTGVLDNSFDLNLDISTLQSVIPFNGQAILKGFFEDINKTPVNNQFLLIDPGNNSINLNFMKNIDKSLYYELIVPAANNMFYVSIIGIGTGQNRTIKRCYFTGEFDNSFTDVTVEGSVNTILPLSSGNILIGGFIKEINSNTTNGLIMVSGSGSRVVSFNQNYSQYFSGPVNGITVIGNQIFVYGDVNKNSNLKFLVCINLDGTEYSGFNMGTGPNNTVFGLIEDFNGKLIIVGRFTSYNSNVAGRIARINLDGTLETSSSGFYSPGFSTFIKDIRKENNEIIIYLGALNVFYNGVNVKPIVKFDQFLNLNNNFNSNLPSSVNGGAYGRLFSANDGSIFTIESSIDNTLDEMRGILAERISGIDTVTYAVTGKNTDGFQAGDEISISGIVPITNFPKYLKSQQKLEPYIINGISVKILSLANGQCQLQIQFNDRELRENKRWCGDIQLSPPADIQDEALRIKSGKNLLIDLSGTANRHTHNPATATFGQPFVNPTLLTIQENAKVVMESGSEMILDRLSTVHFETGSSLEMQDGALIRVRSGSVLKVAGEFNLLGSAKILIEAGGKLEIMPSAEVILTDFASTIEIEDTLVITDGTNFNFTGNGDLVFNKPGGTAYCYLRGASLLNLVGQGSTDIKVKLTNNTKASIIGPITSEVKFSTCKILLGDAALLEVNGKTTFYNSVSDRIQSGQKPIGVRVYALNGSSFSGAWFYNSVIGLDVNLVYSTGNPGFTACKYISNDIGLKIHGKGASISGCTFTSNAEIDLELDANSMIVNVNNCTFNGTGSLGANLKGSAYTHKYNFANCTFTGRTMGLQHEWGSTSLSNCSFTDLETGLHVVAGTVASTCSEFISCDYGITLDEYGRFRTNTQARNIFDGNIVGIWLWQGNINIWGGENQFINNTYDIFGDVKPTPSLLWTNITHSGGSYEFYRWPISRNKFTSLTYPHTFNNVLYGVYGNPDLIQTPYFTVTGSTVAIPDQYDVRPVYIDCVNCGFEFVSCGSGGPGVPIYADYSVLADESTATNVVLNSTYFNNVELKEAIRIASGNISVTLEYPNNDSLALIHFKDILSQNYATGETEIRDALYAAQHLMGRALSNAYSLGILPLKYEAVPEALNIYAIELINQLTAYIGGLSPVTEAEEIGNSTVELALIYRLAAHYTEALDLLNSTEASYASSGRRDYWDCVCKAEYDLITEAYSLEDFQNQLNNSCNAFINYRKQNPFSKDKIDALLASRQKGKINPIRPNPTNLNSQVRLDVKGSFGTVVITDVSGRTVQRIEAKNGINDIELNGSTLDNGVYFVLFFDDNKHLETQKWVISR